MLSGGPRAGVELACVIAHSPVCFNIRHKAAPDQLFDYLNDRVQHICHCHAAIRTAGIYTESAFAQSGSSVSDLRPQQEQYCSDNRLVPGSLMSGTLLSQMDEMPLQ